MDIATYFLRRANFVNNGYIIWDRPFTFIATKSTLYFFYNTVDINRYSQSSIALIVDISKREEELVAHAKALIEQHDLNLLTDYYKHPINLFELMLLLTDQLRNTKDG